MITSDVEDCRIVLDWIGGGGWMDGGVGVDLGLGLRHIFGGVLGIFYNTSLEKGDWKYNWKGGCYARTTEPIWKVIG